MTTFFETRNFLKIIFWLEITVLLTKVTYFTKKTCVKDFSSKNNNTQGTYIKGIYSETASIGGVGDMSIEVTDIKSNCIRDICCNSA